jgi:ketosteroid isomerase-like protein
MSSEHNKALVRKAIDALSRGDLNGFMADAADDASFTLIGSTPLSGTIQGKRNIEQGLTSIGPTPRKRNNRHDD